MKDLHTCANCGAPCGIEVGAKYWHRLTPGLATVLIKFRRAVKAKGENSIHLQKDMTGENELTKSEYANAQKLRYFGLIHHDPQGGKGNWLLTRNGRLFLDGDITVHAAVQTMNNRICERSADQVHIGRLAGQIPFFDDWNFWNASAEHQVVQVGLAL